MNKFWIVFLSLFLAACQEFSSNVDQGNSDASPESNEATVTPTQLNLPTVTPTSTPSATIAPTAIAIPTTTITPTQIVLPTVTTTPTPLPKIEALQNETWFSNPISVNSVINPANTDTWLSSAINFGEVRYFAFTETGLVRIINGKAMSSEESDVSVVNGDVARYSFSVNTNFSVFTPSELNAIELEITTYEQDLTGQLLANYLYDNQWVNKWTQDQIKRFYPGLTFQEGAKAIEVTTGYIYSNQIASEVEQGILLNAIAITNIQSMF